MTAFALALSAAVALGPPTAGIDAACAPLAPLVPGMTAPVANVRAVKQRVLAALPLVGRITLGPGRQALGSGVVIDKVGLILTNHHVVAGATRVQVSLGDQQDLDAEIVGQDPRLDLALLRVRPRAPLTVARLGRAIPLRVGDPVVAVGNPYGLSHSVTAGIISARARLLDVGPRVPLLQTDAPINPGSSGGPLYDREGHVIGITTAMVSGANGIGFAVPIEIAKRAASQLRRHGIVRRSTAGLVLAPVRAPLMGARVVAVDPAGPGARAGIHAGDVITRWDGEAIGSADELAPLIDLTPPGELARVRLRRSGGQLDRAVRVTAY